MGRDEQSDSRDTGALMHLQENRKKVTKSLELYVRGAFSHRQWGVEPTESTGLKSSEACEHQEQGPADLYHCTELRDQWEIRLPVQLFVILSDKCVIS